MPSKPLPKRNPQKQPERRKGPQIVDFAKEQSLLKMTGFSKREAERQVELYRADLALRQKKPLKAAALLVMAENTGPATAILNAFIISRPVAEVRKNVGELQALINSIHAKNPGLARLASEKLRKKLSS